MIDRIKLAEAMEFEVYCDYKFVKYNHTMTFVPLDDLPDPFTDANDDYAVLEWMRDDSRRMEFPRYVGALSDVMDTGHGHKRIKGRCSSLTIERLAASHAANYQIGDYARAALKVLEVKDE